MSTGAPGWMRTASVDSKSATISSRRRLADLEQRLAGGHDRLAFAQPLQDDAVDRRDDLHRAAGRRRRLQARARQLQLVLGCARRRTPRPCAPPRRWRRRSPPLRGCRAAIAPAFISSCCRCSVVRARVNSAVARSRSAAPVRPRRARPRPPPRARRACADRAAARRPGSAARRRSCRGPRRSPGSSSMRCSRPATGADTTNLSRTRVSPSSSSVTCIGPRSTWRRSLRSTPATSPWRRSPGRPRRLRSGACCLRNRIDGRVYSRIFSTATRSS